MDKPDICIWHSHCLDGFTAAWAIHQKWKDIEFVAAQYGDEPPSIGGKHVLIVDFSYPAETLEFMAGLAKSITVLDHHKTAQAALAEYQVPIEVGLPRFKPLNILEKAPCKIQAHFDMDKSGAVLAWQYAWGTASSMPKIIEFVQDRDLWRFHSADTKPVCAVLHSMEFDFYRWTDIAKRIESIGSREGVLAEGWAIMRDRQRLLEDMIAATARMMHIGGYEVPVANVPYAFASDAGDIMARGHPFAASYFDLANGQRKFSLRRRDGDVDVSSIAKQFGGGGHAAAAGFTVNVDGSLLPDIDALSVLDDEDVEILIAAAGPKVGVTE